MLSANQASVLSMMHMFDRTCLIHTDAAMAVVLIRIRRYYKYVFMSAICNEPACFTATPALATKGDCMWYVTAIAAQAAARALLGCGPDDSEPSEIMKKISDIVTHARDEESRGRTILFDECCFWDDKTAMPPDVTARLKETLLLEQSDFPLYSAETTSPEAVLANAISKDYVFANAPAARTAVQKCGMEMSSCIFVGVIFLVQIIARAAVLNLTAAELCTSTADYLLVTQPLTDSAVVQDEDFYCMKSGESIFDDDRAATVRGQGDAAANGELHDAADNAIDPVAVDAEETDDDDEDEDDDGLVWKSMSDDSK